ncbi:MULTISPECIES: hypothetical protein [unclassified Acinetobacter]|uniref:hypothetical protein n=1 Tax=unclassified Acinetobacter TaxID=196816 RepID=UPI0015D26EC3|nr:MULTISPECIES: hypothetical protein [unclassified Acinetobacter]QOW48899.1 hypothetical protein G0029_03245 [Acinetobacter sp. YH12138]UIJ76383.1 hypothetical protein LXF01_03630 [Acinetobacter sp. SH20PTE14]
MIKFIVDENALMNGSHLIHNGTQGCVDMPQFEQQILIGYFANFELAYKRARMSWPTEKVVGCDKCCSQS